SLIADVGRDGDGAELLHRCGIFLGVAPGDRHPGARVCKSLRHAEADAAVAAGDERDFSLEVEEVHAPIIHYLTKASICAEHAACPGSMPCGASTASIRAASARCSRATSAARFRCRRRACCTSSATA